MEDEEIVGHSLPSCWPAKLRGFTSLHRKAILPTIASALTFRIVRSSTQRSINNQRTPFDKGAFFSMMDGLTSTIPMLSNR